MAPPKAQRLLAHLAAVPALWPLRLRRMWRHLVAGPRPLGAYYPKGWRVLAWCGEAVLLVLDLLGVPEAYSLLAELAKPRTRGLRPHEAALARGVFGESLPYPRISVDEGAWLGPPQGRFCYVSFATVNLWGRPSACLLMHELVHVWQFQHWGSVYIPRALAAQHSPKGYNYGGLPALRHATNMADFNPEQQADIVADYCRLLHGLPTHWAPDACADDLPLYQRLMSDFFG